MIKGFLGFGFCAIIMMGGSAYASEDQCPDTEHVRANGIHRVTEGGQEIGWTGDKGKYNPATDTECFFMPDYSSWLTDHGNENNDHPYGTSPEGWAYCPDGKVDPGRWNDLRNFGHADQGCIGKPHSGSSDVGDGNAPFGLIPNTNGHDPHSMESCISATASGNGLPLISFYCDLDAAGIHEASALYLSYAHCSADIEYTVDQTWIPLLGEQLGMIYVDGVEQNVHPQKFTGWTQGHAEISHSLNGITCDISLNAMPGGHIKWHESGDVPIEGSSGSITVAKKRLTFLW